MTASLNGKRDHIPLREIDTRDIDIDVPLKAEDAQAAIERVIHHKLAEMDAELTRLQALLDAKRRPILPPADFGEWLRWAAFFWLIAYGLLVLVEMVTG